MLSHVISTQAAPPKQAAWPHVISRGQENILERQEG